MRYFLVVFFVHFNPIIMMNFDNMTNTDATVFSPKLNAT